MISIESLKESLVGSTVSDLEEAINYFNEQIRLQKDTELAEIDRQMAELQVKHDQEMAKLQAKRDAIRPPQKKNGTRVYKEIINPNNRDQRYTTGPHPIWLTQMLKDALGDTYGDKAAKAALINQWKNGGAE